MNENLNDLQELQEVAVLSEEPKVEEPKVVDITAQILNTDFSTNPNLDEYFDKLENQDRDRKLAKSLEADNVIKDLAPMYLTAGSRDKISEIVAQLDSIIKTYDVTSELIRNMDEPTKDKIYAIALHLNISLASALQNMNFNIELSRSEFKFVFKAFKSKIAYDGNDVLVMLNSGLKNIIDTWYQSEKALPNNINSFMAEIDIKGLVILYQFLSRTTVKGMDEEFYCFAELISKIKEANDVYNAFNIIKERVNNKFLIWAGALSPEIKINDTNSVPGSVVQPEIQLNDTVETPIN